MLTAEQLQARKTGIGGSDIAAALGLSRWKTPYELYLEKTGQSEPPDLSANDNVHFGNVLEDTVAAEFSRRTGLKVRRNNQHLIHPEHEFLQANIDRAVNGKPFGLKCGLECKTVDKLAARDKWGPGSTFSTDDSGELVVVEHDDQVPDEYLLQCVHYMAVTNSDLWFLAALVGGNEFRIYTIQRDADLESMLINRAEKFWKSHVLERSAPPAETKSDLETMYSQDAGTAITADQEAIDIWAQIRQLQAKQKDIELELDGITRGGTTIGGLKNRLRAIIGDNAEVLLGLDEKPIATWKTTKPRKVFDADAFKKDHPKLFREYQVEKPGTRPLLIK